MKKTIVYMFVAIWACCFVSCKTTRSAATNDKAQQWYDQGDWRHGFMPNAYDDINVAMFYDQYQKHPAMYDSIFTWLSSVDGLHVPAGKNVMIWSHAVAHVQDLELRPTEKCKIEQHRHHIDLQWDLSGTERYGLVRDTTVLEAINNYKPDVQNFKSKTAMKRIDSRPDCFFLFFPSDYHQACEIAKKKEVVRKIVVKIEYFQ